MSISQNGSNVCISSENNQNESIKLYFKYIENTDSVIFSLGKNLFKYTSNTFTEAYKKAKENSIMEEQNSVYQRPSFFTNTIKKIIGIRMNGDEE